jgi:uncharacterized membrane protein
MPPVSRALAMLRSLWKRRPRRFLLRRGGGDVASIRALWAVGVMAAAYVALFTGLTCHRFSLVDCCYDLSVFEQSFWSLVREGRLLVNSQEGLEVGRFSHFSLHFSPLLLAVAPIYALWQAPQALLFAKTLALGLAAFPLYWLGAGLFASRAAGLAVAALYLLYPPLHGVNLWGFHENEFAVLPLAFLLVCHERRHPRGFWVAAVAALAAKETMALTVAAFGLWMVLFAKGARRRGAILAAAAVVWFVVCDRLVIPAFRGAGGARDAENVYIAMRYDPRLGTSYGEIAWHCLRHPLLTAQYAFGPPVKQAYLFQLFLPLAFLPLLAPSLLLIAAPVLGQNLLARYLGQVSILGQYHAELIPFFVYGACLGLRRAEGWAAPFGRGPLVRLTLVAALAVATLAANLSFGLWEFALGRRGQFQAVVLEPERREAARRMLALVPPDASVLADWNLISYLGARPWLHLIQRQALDARPWDYIVHDRRFPWHSDFTREEFARRLEADGYATVAEDGDIVVYRRIPPP